MDYLPIFLSSYNGKFVETNLMAPFEQPLPEDLEWLIFCLLDFNDNGYVESGVNGDP
uniref:Uncharacterized protein n=1 Tax=Rhizophora mucronata TaxID=61149 RepID=A0A2P2MXS7_RHIMU